MSLSPGAVATAERRWALLALPLLFGALSIGSGWRAWINPFVDSSREMNVPARLAQGERLYRDVVYHYGPAGPWANALAIQTFGRSFWALETVGLLAGLVLLGALYRLTARAGSPLSACVAVTWAAALCFGAPNGGSFLFPYSFGALLALSGAFLCLGVSVGRPSPAANGLAATGLAVAWSAKPEVGAAAAVLLVAAFLRSAEKGGEKGRLVAVLGIGSLAAALVYGIAFFGLARRDLSPQGPLALFSPPPEWKSVYRLISGFADPRGSFQTVATALFLGLLLLAVAAGAAKLAPRAPRAVEAAWLVGVIGVTVFFMTPAGGSLEDRLPPLLAPLPLTAGLAALLLLRRPLDAAARARFLLFGFSAAIASRVIIGLTYGARTTPYSILAFPGLAATACVLLLDWLPRRFPLGPGRGIGGPEVPREEDAGDRELSTGGRPPTLGSAVSPGAYVPREDDSDNILVWRRFLTFAFIGLSVIAAARWRRLQPRDRVVEVATPAGTVRLPREKAFVTAQTLDFLSARARPGDGLAGFPETGFFNFVTGLSNPLRQEQVLPGHLDAADERQLIERLESNGPRFLLLANQPTTAFGPISFGKDYARDLLRAVERLYQAVAFFGSASPDAAVGAPGFFIRVYERR